MWAYRLSDLMRSTGPTRIGKVFWLVLFTAILVGVPALPPSTRAQGGIPAFRGAEGFGAGATGGRGGRVVIVTTLEPSGPGSFGDALDPSTCEPRIIVFEVSGVIQVPSVKNDLELTCGNVTIAGQTAPGGGITLNARLVGVYAEPGQPYVLENIIIRHLRVRPRPLTGPPPDGLGWDAIGLSQASRVILDHVSASWGSDEVIELYEGTDVTIQWSTIEESNPVGSQDGEPHNLGFITGGDAAEGERESARISFHHNLCAHHRRRCPAMHNGPAEVTNNLVYDVQGGFAHDGPAEGEFHIVGNTFLDGPSSDDLVPFVLNDENTAAGPPAYWIRANALEDPAIFTGIIDDPFQVQAGTPLYERLNVGLSFAQDTRPFALAQPTDFRTLSQEYRPISEQAPEGAAEAILATAGAWPRDPVTRRTIDEVRNRTGGWGVTEPADLFEGLTQLQAPADVDRDGMADEWESQHGLNPGDATDHSRVMPSGYTAIEEYINELADSLVGDSGPGQPSPGATGPVVTPAVSSAPTQVAVVSPLAVPSATGVGGPVTSPRATAGGVATGAGGGPPTSPAAPSDELVVLAGLSVALSAVAVALSAVALFLVAQWVRRGRDDTTPKD